MRTRIRTYVESITAISPSIMTHLEERKAKLEHYWAEYNSAITSRIRSVRRLRSKQEAFYALSAKIHELISPSAILRTSIFSVLFKCSLRLWSAHVQLPKLNLSTFSGNDEYDSRFSIHSTQLSIPTLLSNT